MGFFTVEGDDHIESIVFFLSDALRAAIEAGDKLQLSVCNAPKFTPGMSAGEIADRLAEFRRQTGDLWSLEALMLTKILRAGELVRELRDFESGMKPEFDTFRLATVLAEDLRSRLMPDAERVFDGAAQPKCFLEARSGYEMEGKPVSRNEPGVYKLGGEIDVRLLMDACEALHFSLASRFGVDSGLLRLEASMEVAPAISGKGTEQEPFLLSEMGEMLVDDIATPQAGWPGKMAQRTAIRH